MTTSPRKFTPDEINGLINWLTDEQGFYKFERIMKEALANPVKRHTSHYRVKDPDGSIYRPKKRKTSR